MSTEIQIINPKEFGIEESKANELYGNLPQIKAERDELEKQFAEVVKMDIENPEPWKTARELRLLIQKNRTQGIVVWHKTTKDFFLKGGQFVDAIKRKEVAVNERMESDLEQIEKYEQIIEQKRLAELQEKRAEQLAPYVENASELNLSGMDADVWHAYFQVKKQAYIDRIEAEKKAEAERIAKEKAEAEERERIRLENIKLKKEAEERKEHERKEREAYEAKLKAEREKAEAERKERERIERIEREKREKLEAELRAKAEAERKERERIERIEREKREKLEAELRAKAEAERKAKEAEEAKLQAELNKGDADKVKDLINDFESLKTKYTFKSAKNKKMYSDVSGLIDKVIVFIQK